MFPFKVGMTFLEHSSGIIWKIVRKYSIYVRLVATNRDDRRPVNNFLLDTLDRFLREKRITILSINTIEKMVLRRKPPRTETGT